jgi:streptogrisin C
VLVSLAVALQGGAGAAQAAEVGGAKAAPTGRTGASEVADASVAAYERVFPRMSRARAAAATRGADDREAVYAALVGRHAGTYGGAWFDPPSGTLHIAMTTGAAAAAAADLAEQHGVRASTRVVRHSFVELERLATEVRSGTSALGRAAGQDVGIDVRRNTVVAAVPAAVAATSRAAALPAGVAVAADPQLSVEQDAGCTTRAACDWTVRAGAMLWRGGAGSFACSVGFTGRTSSGARYVLTAGHCSNGNGVQWGTGSLPIGPMEASRDSGPVDAAVVRVTNSWFTGDLGGEIYHPTVASRSLPVKGVAPTLGYIVAGETVCLSANFQAPAGSSYCGVVGTTSDAAVRGMVRVDGYDACPGDSGGGWYWNSSAGRYAYGLHSRSSTGCRVSGGTSWFSALPTVKSTFVPGITVETR